MAKETVIKMLQVDLGQLDPPTEVMEYMATTVDHAINELRTMGIDVDVEAAEDMMLIVRYAAWLYKARDKAESRPWQLQREINNRRISRETGRSGCNAF